jgi:drug/metabolite transporter (DMT)-like permease
VNLHASPHLKAILLNLLVTFLWSTSWVLIRLGLHDLPPLTYAALRYSLATVVLLPFVLRTGVKKQLQQINRRQWGLIILLALCTYPLAQSGQYLALDRLPTVTVSLVLNMTPIVVTILGIWFLHEHPFWRQYIGIAISFLGIFIFFYPPQFPSGAEWGFLAAGLCLLSTAVAAICGRFLNRGQALPAVTLTAITLCIGAPILLVIAIVNEGLPHLNWTVTGYIVWLAVVNTAIAFTLWNHALRTLSAMESSIINNTMTIQIAIMAWIFLGEGLSLLQIIGIVIAILGSVLVQLQRKNPAPNPQTDI